MAEDIVQRMAGSEPMNPRVKLVRPNPDHALTIVFDNGETRRFDVKPSLEKGVFKELRSAWLYPFFTDCYSEGQ